MLHSTPQIDIRRVISNKMPQLYPRIPNMALKALEKLIHQDELNNILKRNSHLSGVDFMRGVIKMLSLNIITHGTEHIASHKRFIFASNHPLGGVDGICLSATIGKLFDDKVQIPVNEILCEIPQLRNIFIPINKYGTQSRETAQMLHKAFVSDNQVIIFPAGLCSRYHNGKITDRTWGKMFIRQAIKYRRDIVPVYFSGKNSALFYTLAKWREWMKVKFNFEMLLLPREMLRTEQSTFHIYFGKPIPWHTFNPKQSLHRWAKYVQQASYQLPKQFN